MAELVLPTLRLTRVPDARRWPLATIHPHEVPGRPLWRVLPLVGALVVLVVLLAACGETQADGRPRGKGLVVIGEPQVTRNGPLVTVTGRVKNEGARPFTGSVVVTLFDASGKIVGTCTGAVSSVPPGAEGPYQAVSMSAITGDWIRVEATISPQGVPTHRAGRRRRRVSGA